jgi:hypothetical protein
VDAALYQRLRSIERDLNALWRGHENAELPAAARRSQEALRRHIRLALLAARDYELSAAEQDTRAQLRLLPKLTKELEQVRASILKASEFDLVGAVDVAQLTSQLDSLTDQLQ